MMLDGTFQRSPGAATSSARTATSVRFEALDSWRGICALLVALFHFPANSELSQSRFIVHSYLFVDFFFVLSGFVIAASYAGKLRNPGDGVKFAAIRLGRVYPLHAAVLAAFVALELMRLMLSQPREGRAAPFTEPFDLESLPANLLLIQSMGVLDRLAWNGPSWSISAEIFTYLSFAVAMALFDSRAWIALAGATLLAPLALYFFGASNMDLSYDWGFVRCIAGFSLGALIAQIQHQAIVARRSQPRDAVDGFIWSAIEIAMVFAIVIFVVTTGDIPASIAAPFVFGLAIYLFAHERGVVSAILRKRLFLLLGALSYSIYMVHVFVQTLMYSAASIVDRKLNLGILGNVVHHAKITIGFGPSSQPIALAATAIMLVAVVIAAYFTWRFIEMPALSWTKRKVASIAARDPTFAS